MADVAHGLAGVRIDDAVSRHAQAHDQVNLSCRGAVKATAQGCKHGQHAAVGVALHRIEGSD